MKYVSRVGGAGQYAHVKLHVQPGAPGTGFVFHNAVTGGAIPGEFIKPIEYGVEDALTRGVVAGYPVEDVRVDLYDGSYHDIDSSETAFKIAGSMAFQAAARQAGPVVLEPVMRVQVTVDDEYAEEVRGNLLSRRGENLSQHDRGDRQFISAWVPLAELFGYSTDLRSRTRGRGTVVGVELVGYAPAPPLDDDDDRDSRVGAPRTPPSPLRTFGIALPEPDADDTIV
jgi:elongation factor G